MCIMGCGKKKFRNTPRVNNPVTFQFANGYNGLLRAGSIGMVSFLSFTIFTVSGQAFQSEVRLVKILGTD
jgi:hypothetical protein